jgi:hypothetical protein
VAGLKLYEITNAILDSQHEEVNTDAITALQISFQDKAVGCACVVKNLDAEVSAIDAEIRRLQDLKTTRQNNVDRLKAYLLTCMQAAGVDKVESGVHQIRRQLSPMSIEIVNEDSVPVQFKTEVVTVKIDKKGILDHLKATGEIPDGCDAKRNEHLRIK